MSTRGCKKTPTIDLSKALQEYVKVIHSLQQTSEHGSAAASDIAKQLGVRAPSVTSALQKLAALDMVEYQRYQEARLTPKGKEIAEKLDHRHKTILDLLRLIGVEEETANEDACEIEHIVHPETIERLSEYLKKIGTK
jgi:DtxR family Mn-dependent transcriptional regulator